MNIYGKNKQKSNYNNRRCRWSHKRFHGREIKKQPLKIRIKNSIYKHKRKKAEKVIVANPHSLSETVEYAKDKYGLNEIAFTDKKYIEQKKDLKESLILQYKPELLGENKDIQKPDFRNEETVREFWNKTEARSKMIAQMPDNVITMNFHLYEIKIDDNSLEIEIDYEWNIFGVLLRPSQPDLILA